MKCTRFGIVAIACAVILSVAACFSPLQGTEKGTLAVRVAFPDSIHAMQSQQFVGRLYVVNAAYEDLLRRVLAYEDFLDTFYYEVPISAFAEYPMLLHAFLRLEEIMDELDEDLFLKAPVMFGGAPYFDFTVTNPQDGGSVTPPGVPSNRPYYVYLDMWVPGTQDADGADPVYESVAWEGADPFQLLESYGDSDPVDRLHVAFGLDDVEAVTAALTLVGEVIAAYRDTQAYPFIPAVIVPRGGTASVTLQMREFGQAPQPD